MLRASEFKFHCYRPFNSQITHSGSAGKLTFVIMKLSQSFISFL